jgi:hypothetical protein
MPRSKRNVASKCLVAAVLLATPALTFSSPAIALTISPGACTDGDICIADGNLSGGSLTTSCRVYGWDLTSAESFVGPFSNYAYPGGSTGCPSLNVNDTANSTRNRMNVSQRKACFFDASNGIGTVVHIDVYSPTITWKTIASGGQNKASSLQLYAPGTSGCP